MGHSRDENKRDKIRERRRTLWFFHSRMNAPRDLTGIELSMLPEDIDHRIMPSGGTSRDWPDYRVAVEPYSKKAEEAVLLRSQLMNKSTTWNQRWRNSSGSSSAMSSKTGRSSLRSSSTPTKLPGGSSWIHSPRAASSCSKG